MPSRLAIVVMLMVTWYQSLPGQSEVRIGIGDSFIAEDFPEGRSYHIWLVAVGYARKFFNLGEHTFVNGIVDLQYGDATTLSQDRYDFDLAANFSLELDWKLHPSLSFVAAIGSGPGYQSSVSIVQDRGFVFSNNFMAGLRLSITHGSLLVSPQVRFRHMSNAGISSPNQGIDNFLIALHLAMPL